MLNVAPDHLSWHGDLRRYTAAKAKIYHQTPAVAAVYNVEDPETRTMVEEAEVVEGCRAIGFTMGIPAMGMVGVVDDVIADRAFIEGRERNAAELARVVRRPDGRAAQRRERARRGRSRPLLRGRTGRPCDRRCQSFTLDRHRIEEVAVVDGVRYVDDSKATNPQAALASLRSYDAVVWVAGGLAKGATFDEVVQQAAGRLRAAVLLGADRHVIAEALARHAPDVPVIEVTETDTGVMERVVDAATRVAREGDTVLLAPACASQDLFVDYAATG